MYRKDRRQRIPSYRLHKASGLAVVTLNGRDVYLGQHGSAESRSEYDRLISEWIGNGRQLPTDRKGELTVVELLSRYWAHARAYYVKNGGPTSEQCTINAALRPVRRLYGHTSVESFGPAALKAVRQAMIDQGWCRNHVNKQISRVKTMFKWGVENELIAPSIYHRLVAVAGLRAGRCEVRESDPILPVPDSDVDAVRPFVSHQIWAMIQLQRLTGMRSGEVTIMRACDLDMSGKVWIYTPATHKTEHHGRARLPALGPRAQAIIEPWLERDVSAYLFSPVGAEAQRFIRLQARRKTPVQPSQQKRKELGRRRRRVRPPKDHYSTASYGRAIARACDLAFLPPKHLQPAILACGNRETKKQLAARLTESEKAELKQWQRQQRWHPHQLRHTAATRLRKEFGIEAARVVLGHKSAMVTEVYAEIDTTKAIDIMARVG